jgi:DNA primase
VRERTGDGTEIRCRCPCHEDPDAHLYVNAVSGAAFCHRCGLETHLGALCGDESYPADGDGVLRYRILAATAAYYHHRLTEEARHYLVEERNLRPEVLDRFQVGWADGGLRKHLLEEEGFPLEACVDAGVLKQDEQGVRDFFYRRIVFPNVVASRVVHLSCRLLGDGKPKWLHLPGEIEHPYNADALREPGCVWTEGILDVLSLACWGIPAVAGLGTHIKEEWVTGLPDDHRVHVCLDGDVAGGRGTANAAQALGDRARIVVLPDGKDPNDLLVEGRREDFETCLLQAVDLLTFRIHQVPADAPRTELPRLLGDVLKQIAAADPASAEAYLGVLKSHLVLKREEVNAYRQVVKELRATFRSGADCTAPHQGTYAAQFDGLVDLVEHEGEPAFLIMMDKEPQVITAAEREGKMLVPPPKETIPWLLPRAEEVLRHYEADSDAKLYDALVAYHRDISELPDEAWYEFIATWDLHTYLLEGMQYSPEFCLVAVPERGKSRTGKGIICVAYRGIHVESLRDAYIVRFAHYFGGTIFFDVMGLWRKAERECSQDVILGRFERGVKVPRVLYPDRGPHQDTVYFSIFGPTIIGTNESIHHILDTRAVTIVMPEATRRFEEDVTPEAARPFRERLVAFRARHLNEPLPEVNKPAAGRLGDILRPLRQIVRLVRPDRERASLAFVASLHRLRLQEKADTLEAALLRILDGLCGEVTADGLLPVRLVTERLNEGRLEKDQISAQKVGMRLRSLGFQKGRREEAGATIQWDEDALERAMQAYGLQESTDSTDSAGTRPGQDLFPDEAVESVESDRDVGGGDAHTPPVACAPEPWSDEPEPEPCQPCFTCHGTRFWLDTEGVWKCGTCHPPASEDLVQQWLEMEGEEAGDAR